MKTVGPDFHSAPAGAAYYSPALSALGGFARVVKSRKGRRLMGSSNAFSTVPKAGAQPGELFVSAVPREPRARAKPSDEKRSAQKKVYIKSEDGLALGFISRARSITVLKTIEFVCSQTVCRTRSSLEKSAPVEHVRINSDHCPGDVAGHGDCGRVALRRGRSRSA